LKIISRLRTKINTEFARDRFESKNLSVISPVKFKKRNSTSPNIRFGMSFRMGLAKMWLPRGQDFKRTRVYLCRLNAALDMVGYYYVQCRVLTLGNFTTTDKPGQMGLAVDVQYHNDRVFVAEEYLEKNRYKLGDYCLRTIRQRIRKLFAMEGVEPADWSEDKANGMIRAPGSRMEPSIGFTMLHRELPSRI